jgi:hypothetical protein
MCSFISEKLNFNHACDLNKKGNLTLTARDKSVAATVVTEAKWTEQSKNINVISKEILLLYLEGRIININS